MIDEYYNKEAEGRGRTHKEAIDSILEISKEDFNTEDREWVGTGLRGKYWK